PGGGGRAHQRGARPAPVGGGPPPAGPVRPPAPAPARPDAAPTGPGSPAGGAPLRRRDGQGAGHHPPGPAVPRHGQHPERSDRPVGRDALRGALGGVDGQARRPGAGPHLPPGGRGDHPGVACGGGGAVIISPVVLTLTWEALQETLLMVGVAAVLAELGGLPLGVLLVTTAPGRILASPRFHHVLGLIVNVGRSIPF